MIDHSISATPPPWDVVLTFHTVRPPRRSRLLAAASCSPCQASGPSRLSNRSAESGLICTSSMGAIVWVGPDGGHGRHFGADLLAALDSGSGRTVWSAGHGGGQHRARAGHPAAGHNQ